MARLLTLTIIGGIGIGGCVADISPNSDRQQDEPKLSTTQVVKMQTSLNGFESLDGTQTVFEDGREWVSRALTSADFSRRQPAKPYALGASDSLDIFSDEQLADLLRPIRLVTRNGHRLEQRATQTTAAELEAVKRARDLTGKKAAMRAHRGEYEELTIGNNTHFEKHGVVVEAPNVEKRGGQTLRLDWRVIGQVSPLLDAKLTDQPNLSLLGETSPKYVDFADGRDWVSTYGASTSPGNAAVALDDNPNHTGTLCSATLIGDHTAISVGHCFIDPSTGSHFYNDFDVGLVRRKIDPDTTTIYTTSAYSPPANTTDCFDVYVPSGYGSAAWFDIAVVMFNTAACNYLHPGASGRFMTPSYHDPSYYPSSAAQLQAYDVETPDLPQNYLPTRYVKPSQITRFTPASSHPAYVSLTLPSQYWPELVFTTLDTTDGADGGGLLMDIRNSVGDFDFYWVGTLVGDIHFSFFNNYFRRLEATIWSWIQSKTDEY